MTTSQSLNYNEPGAVDTAAATGDKPPDGGLAAWLSGKFPFREEASCFVLALMLIPDHVSNVRFLRHHE